VVSEITPLLTQAARLGNARGVLEGASARYLQERFDSREPVLIEVQALYRLPVSGCSRLQVLTRQAGVLEHGRRADARLVYHIDHCSDGRPPQSR
jgi:hypothetical protein